MRFPRRLLHARTWALLGLIPCLPGCVPTSTFLITDVGFNPRLRGDLQALTEAQRLDTQPGFGPYRLGGEQLLSPVWPVSSFRGDGRTAANMVQSDCLWLGRRDSAGDRLQLNYEQTWEWSITDVECRGTAPPGTPRSDDCHPFVPFKVAELTGETAQIAACDGRDPVNRTEPHLNPRSGPGDTLVFIDALGQNVRSTSDPPPAAGQLVIACYHESAHAPDHRVMACNPDALRAVPTARLVRYREQAGNDIAANPDGECRSGNTRPQRTLLEQGHDNLSLPSRGVDLPACGLAATLHPERDASYALLHSVPGTFGAPPPVEQRVGPDVMVVDRSRTLRRPMTAQRQATQPVSQLWSWQVGVSTAGTAMRWSENFSPSLTVTQVQVKARLANGQPLAWPISTALCIEGEAGLGCTYRCSGTAQSDGARFALNAQSCVNANGTAIAPDLTPAFDNLQLPDAPGRVQARPLRWRLLDPLPLNAQLGTLIIEFDLLARVGQGAALRASAGQLDFGALQVGSNQVSVRRFELFNDGDVPLVLTAAAPLGMAAADFSVQFSDRAVQVPLPIDQWPIAPVIGTGTWALGPAPSPHEPLPPHLQLVDYGKDIGQGLRLVALPYARFALYEQDFEIRNGVTTIATAGFDFERAAQTAFAQNHPEVQADGALVGRPFSFPAYVLRELPLELAPGESVQVHVSQRRPGGLGERSAHLQIDAVTRAGPVQTRRVQIGLRGRGVSGAILDAVPTRIALPRVTAQGSFWSRQLAVVNVGESAGELARAELSGADAALFSVQTVPGQSLPRRLGAGEAQVLVVEASVPSCATPTTRTWQAELALITADGRKHLLPVEAAAGACQ